MQRKNILKTCLEHKYVLIFAAGIATALIGKKVIESKAFKDATSKGLAAVMSTKKDAEEILQNMKENAEDNVDDANAEDKKDVYLK